MGFLKNPNPEVDYRFLEPVSRPAEYRLQKLVPGNDLSNRSPDIGFRNQFRVTNRGTISSGQRFQRPVPGNDSRNWLRLTIAEFGS